MSTVIARPNYTNDKTLYKYFESLRGDNPITLFNDKDYSIIVKSITQYSSIAPLTHYPKKEISIILEKTARRTPNEKPESYETKLIIYKPITGVLGNYNFEGKTVEEYTSNIEYISLTPYVFDEKRVKTTLNHLRDILQNKLTPNKTDLDYMFLGSVAPPTNYGGSKLRKTRRNKTRKSRKHRRKSVRRVSKKV